MVGNPLLYIFSAGHTPSRKKGAEYRICSLKKEKMKNILDPLPQSNNLLGTSWMDGNTIVEILLSSAHLNGYTKTLENF